MMETFRQQGMVHTSSFEEEVTAMGIAAVWAVSECSADKPVMVCTDSQVPVSMPSARGDQSIDR